VIVIGSSKVQMSKTNHNRKHLDGS